jgi:mannose-6-phosphate isomerase
MAAEEEARYEAFRKGILEDKRPWGSFQRFPLEGVTSAKIITVEPGGILSLQYHHNRDEFWVILDDGLEMTLDDRVWRPMPGEQIWIPRGTRHRVKGVGHRTARFFELWLGDSDETDIVRVEDIYRREK